MDRKSCNKILFPGFLCFPESFGSSSVLTPGVLETLVYKMPCDCLNV